ncbi:S1 family peptidase [Saccharothrix sp. NPDC042600]|uniref:S1 family peptidase n=1 Tax=Saccharothrix TaxID=2071 RepID=UPI0033EF0FB3|nr:S1 family peptidase [Saccharothrix mutabilis subsp. capreolus]
MHRRKKIHGVIAGMTLAVAGLTAAPAAAEPTDDPATAALLEALRRDLGLTEGQALARFDAQDAAMRLDADLVPGLGDDHGGSWLDETTAKLVVAVTTTEDAEQVRAAGAEARVVTRTLRAIESVKTELDQRLDAEPDAFAGVAAWHADPKSNAVVITVVSGQTPGAAVRDAVARHGDAVRVVETDAAPAAAALLRGGDGYWSGAVRCSAGFNAVNGNNRYFLTAGHCGPYGTPTSANGTAIGVVSHSTFPGVDRAAVRVSNTAAWQQGPWVNAYANEAKYYIHGKKSSLAGTSVCKSGATTKLTCGVIKAKGETILMDHDNNPNTAAVKVSNLTRHNACVEPGDSGGSNFSWEATKRNYAEGMTSAGRFTPDKNVPNKLRCLSHDGKENVSWFSLVSDALTGYSLTLLTAP